MIIEVRDVTKTFQATAALDRVSLRVETGELLALLGPSGCGKTTLLRIIAGLEVPDPGSGKVLFNGEDVTGTATGRRKVGFVFQHYALFRHMTVFENIAFGLRVRSRATRPRKPVIESRVRELLRLIQMENLAQRFPRQLSGGQRQRVALARALAVEPRLLLLDEPFGSLDARVRQELRRWLRRLHDEIHLTSLFVTHDQEEALELADRVVVMNEGRIVQIGTPDEVFHRPATEFVMTFLGNVNFFPGIVSDGSVLLMPAAEGHATGRYYVRPHDFDLSLAPGPGSLSATVVRVHSAGPQVRVELRCPGKESFLAEISQEQSRSLELKAGRNVHVFAREVRAFPVDGGAVHA